MRGWMACWTGEQRMCRAGLRVCVLVSQDDKHVCVRVYVSYSELKAVTRGDAM